MHTNKSPKELFWEKVNKNGRVVRTELGPCWEWTGSRDRAGYGQLTVRRQSVRAHRFAFTVQHDAVPQGLDVLHRCDNPSCVRGDHLFAGSHATNMQDMIAKERSACGARNGRATHPEKTARGSRNARSRLTEEQVRQIRSSSERMSDLARRYGVSHTTISAIVRGNRWTHVES